MKRIALLFVPIMMMSACSFSSGPSNKVVGKTFEKSIDGYYYVGVVTWSISFYKNNLYDIHYSKVGAHDENHNAVEDIHIDLLNKTWKYLRTETYSWTGDWNAHHTNTYYIYSLSDHPLYEGGGFFVIERSSNLGYIMNKDPGNGGKNGNDFSNGEPVVEKKKDISK